MQGAVRPRLAMPRDQEQCALGVSAIQIVGMAHANSHAQIHTKPQRSHLHEMCLITEYINKGLRKGEFSNEE